VHLEVAQLGADLVLLEVLEEPHDDRLALQLAQALQQVRQGQPVLQLDLVHGRLVARADVQEVAGEVGRAESLAAGRGVESIVFVVSRLGPGDEAALGALAGPV
jgi:hypothetical protein